jgi:endonuclease YncB( thermonuclease family)
MSRSARYGPWLLVAVLFMIAMCSDRADAAREGVTKVKDCDTFEIAGHTTFGLATSIRVLGIDCPESHLPPAKCPEERDHGLKAADYAKELVARSGGLVWTSGRVKRDKYNGRYLFKVWLRIDGQRVSWARAMIEAGYARDYIEDGDGKLTKPDWCKILATPGQPVDLLPGGFEPVN